MFATADNNNIKFTYNFI